MSSGLITSLTNGAQVISLLVARSAENAELTGLVTAQNNVTRPTAPCVSARHLTRTAALRVAEGCTLPKLILSVCKRSKPPWMTLSAWSALEDQTAVAVGPGVASPMTGPQ
jgi:hypothetical protein